MPDDMKILSEEIRSLRTSISLLTAHVKSLTEKIDRLKDVK